MSEQNEIRLFDRVKELTYTQGTTDFALSGAAQGFSRLNRYYEHLETVFYAATDGIRYEVGSGIFRRSDHDPDDEITYDQLERFPFRSSNPDNSIVNFPPGVKEVFVTYPATHSVIMGSGVPNINTPKRKGVAIWDSENILNYFSSLTYDDALKSFGLNQPNHFYGIDVGGNAQEFSSRVRASGYYVGPTGVFFQSGNGANANLHLRKPNYTGGTQFVHFHPNQTDQYLAGTDDYTNSHEVIQVSGDVNQYILLQKQDAHTVFAGPVDDCLPSCESNYPLFRKLVLDDLPVSEMSDVFTTFDDLIATSGSLVQYTDSQVMNSGNYILGQVSGVQNALDVHISGYESDFRDLEVAISGKVDTYLHRAEHENPYCTVRGDNVDGNSSWGANGENRTTNYAVFPFSHVESASEVSDWDTTNYWYTVPRSGTYSVTANMAFNYDTLDSSDVDNVFRLSTSGDAVATNYLASPAFGQPDANASSSWTVNLPSGHVIYLEYKGQSYNYSKLSIHKI